MFTNLTFDQLIDMHAALCKATSAMHEAWRATFPHSPKDAEWFGDRAAEYANHASGICAEIMRRVA